MGRMKKEKKRGMQGHNGMGYCPFPVLGRDPEMVSRQVGPGTRVRARRPSTRPSVRVRHGFGARVTWVRHFGVATQILVSRHGLAIWRHDTVFGVMTEGAAGVSRHGFWRREQKASLWAEFGSRHSS